MKLQVLLIEDNLVNLDVQTRMLQKLGPQVTVAVSGQEGLAKYKIGLFDLVFIDWQMPEMDGTEVAAMIRAQGNAPLLVVISGHALPGDKEELLAQGFDDYLSKPVRIADFKELLERWFPET